MLLKSHKYLSYALALLFAASGLIIFGGLWMEFMAAIINIVIGLMFMLMALYLWFRARTVSGLLRAISDQSIELEKLLKRNFYIQEFIFLFLGLFVGSILFSGIWHRVFTEQTAVFG